MTYWRIALVLAISLFLGAPSHSTPPTNTGRTFTTCLWGNACAAWQCLWGGACLNWQKRWSVSDGSNWSNTWGVSGFTYTNGMEFTGCVNEVGSNPSTTAIPGGTTNCDYLGAGVTEGVQAQSTNGADTFELRNAFDATGYANVYFQTSILVDGSATFVESDVFYPLDASWVGQYPQMTVAYWPAFSLRHLYLRCSAGVTDSYTSLAGNTVYYVQMDTSPLSASQQEIRLYSSVGALLDTLNCNTSGAQNAYRGVFWAFSQNSKGVVDGLKVSSNPLPAP